ncbi:MAG: hypothetical protein ACKOPS_12900, partial [Cyanobium sp.]
MLTTVLGRCRCRCRYRVWAAALALLPGVLAPAGALAQDPSRPPGLVVLEERPSQAGPRVLGIYGPRRDAASPDLWR